MSRQQMRWHKLAVLQRLAVPEYEPTLSTSRSVEDETIWARSLTSNEEVIVGPCPRMGERLLIISSSFTLSIQGFCLSHSWYVIM